MKSPICSGSFSTSLWLPCLHTLKSIQEHNGALLLEHFHSHWHLQRDGVTQQFLEPLWHAGSFRQSSRIPQQSMRREPSSFEEIEMTRAPPKCSRCHQTGHAMNCKSCPQRHDALLVRIAAPIHQPSDRISSPAAPPNDHTNAIPARITTTAKSIPPRITTTFPVLFVRTEQEEGVVAQIDDNFPAETTPPSPDGLSETCEPSRENAPTLGGFIPDPPRFDPPQAIYARYVAARTVWYAAQPLGSIKTNQLYRKAKGLPLRYDKQSYEWCLDYKQRSKRCTSQSGTR